jgi:hypothetical protein
VLVAAGVTSTLMPTSSAEAVTVFPVSSSMILAEAVENSCPLTKMLPNAVTVPLETALGVAVPELLLVLLLPPPPPQAANVRTAARLEASPVRKMKSRVRCCMVDPGWSYRTSNRSTSYGLAD